MVLAENLVAGSGLKFERERPVVTVSRALLGQVAHGPVHEGLGLPLRSWRHSGTGDVDCLFVNDPARGGW